MAYGGLGQFGGTDFKNQCYKGKFENFQTHFDISSVVFSHIANYSLKSCLPFQKVA